MEAIERRVACVQAAPRLGEVEVNRVRWAALIPEGHALVVLPELATTGYFFGSRDDLRRVAEPLDGPSSAFFREVARERCTCIAYGYAERDGDHLYNAAALVGPDGLLANYRKVHLFGHERSLFAPGEAEWPVVELDGWRVGLMICYDWYFPESLRILALKGADVVAHPSNLVLPNCQGAMPTRALENRVFTMTANRVGSETRGAHTLTYTGGSLIVSPRGDILARASRENEEVVSALIRPQEARDKHASPYNDLFADRRPSLYTRLTAAEAKSPAAAPDPRAGWPYRRNVAALITDGKGHVLAGERADIPGAWQIPQGGVANRKESEEAAIRRELREELGLADVEVLEASLGCYTYDFPPSLAPRSITERYRGQAQRFFVVRLPSGVEPDLAKSDGEFRAWRWMGQAALLEATAAFKRQALAHALAELGPLLTKCEN